MVTDLVQIRHLGEAEEEENLRFRRYVKSHRYPGRLFRKIAQGVQDRIDCKVCANCCRQTRVNISPQDTQSLARYLKMREEQVIKEYTIADLEDGQKILRHAEDGCVFLDGNLCAVYQARPRACREFPYLTSDERSLGGRMSSVCRHACICPIVYNSLAAYKKQVGYHPSRRRRAGEQNHAIAS